MEITGYGPFDNSLAQKWLEKCCYNPQVGHQICSSLREECPFRFRAAAFFFNIIIRYTYQPGMERNIDEVVLRLTHLLNNKEDFIEQWIDKEAVRERLISEIHAFQELSACLRSGKTLPPPRIYSDEEGAIVQLITKAMTHKTKAMTHKEEPKREELDYGPLENRIGHKWIVNAVMNTNFYLQLHDGLEAECHFTFRAAAFSLQVVAAFTDKPLEDLLKAKNRLIQMAKGTGLSSWPDKSKAREALLAQAAALDKTINHLQGHDGALLPEANTINEREMTKILLRRTRGYDVDYLPLYIIGIWPLENATAYAWVDHLLDNTNFPENFMAGLRAECPFTFRAAAYVFYLILPYTIIKEFEELIPVVLLRLTLMATASEPFHNFWQNPEPIQEAVLIQSEELNALYLQIRQGALIQEPEYRTPLEAQVALTLKLGLTGKALD